MQANVMSEKCKQSELLSTLSSSVDTDDLKFAKNKDSARKVQLITLDKIKAPRATVVCTPIGSLSRFFVNILSKPENDLRTL